MIIVKHLKDSSSQQSQKRPYPYWIKSIPHLLSATLLGSLVGTYLDLYFVGMGLYSFPIRPMSSIFSINLTFTLIGLPLLVGVFLFLCDKLNGWKRVGLIMTISLMMSVGEKLAEAFGYFVHQESWKHSYSFVGYSLYLTLIYGFYKCLHLFEKNK